MFRPFTFSFLVVFLFSCSGDKGTKFFTEEKVYDEIGGGSRFSYLVKLSNDSVYNTARNGIKIKRPKEFAGSEIVWGLFYETVLKKSPTKGASYFLIRNYDSNNPEIVFDVNGNADFSDDTIFRISPDSTFFVQYKNRQIAGAEVKSKYIYRFDSINPADSQIHRIMTYGLGVALPSNYIVYSKNLNVKKVILPDSNVISLKDVDVDGCFYGKLDKIIAGDVTKSPGLLKQRLKCKKTKAGEELIFDNNTYKVEKIDKYGQYIYLTTLNIIRDSIEQLPDISYTDIEGGKNTMAVKNDKELSVFYIWGTWCIGCHFQSKELARLMKEYDHRVNFYTLNTGDKKDKMVTYVQKNNYPFQLYRISANTAEDKLFAETFPTFIIADSKKKILLRTSSVIEVENYLKK